MVDDRSTDNTYEIARNYEIMCKKIKLVKTNYNLGVAGARNVGFREASGDVIAYLDCDDEFVPDYFEFLNEIFSNGQTDIAFFGYEYINHLNDINELYIWNPVLHYKEFFIKNLSVPLGVAHYQHLIKEFGGFDDSLWMQEDWDYWRRLVLAGAKMSCFSKVIGKYHLRSEGATMKPKIRDWQINGYKTRWEEQRFSLYGRDFTGTDLVGKPRKIICATYLDIIDYQGVFTKISRVFHNLTKDNFDCMFFCSTKNNCLEDLEKLLVYQNIKWTTKFYDIGSASGVMVLTEVNKIKTIICMPIMKSNIEMAVRDFSLLFEGFIIDQNIDIVITCDSDAFSNQLIIISKNASKINVSYTKTFLYKCVADIALVDYILVDSNELRIALWEQSFTFATNIDYILENKENDYFKSLCMQPGPPFTPLKLTENTVAS